MHEFVNVLDVDFPLFSYYHTRHVSTSPWWQGLLRGKICPLHRVLDTWVAFPRLVVSLGYRSYLAMSWNYSGFEEFPGTSASAPVAAAIATLIRAACFPKV